MEIMEEKYKSAQEPGKESILGSGVKITPKHYDDSLDFLKKLEVELPDTEAVKRGPGAAENMFRVKRFETRRLPIKRE